MAGRNNEPTVGLCVKYTLFFFNLIFWIVGLLLLFFGVWALYAESSFSSFLTDAGSLDPLWFIVIIGCVIFLIAFAGCIGSLRENTCLLKTYKWMMVIMLLLEIVGIVLAIVYQTQVEEYVAKWMRNSIKVYYDESDVQAIVDGMQSGLKCCGAIGPKDWEENVYFNCSSPAASKCSVPYSCCTDDSLYSGQDDGIINYQCGYGTLVLGIEDQINVIYTDGCVEAMRAWLQTNVIIICVSLGVVLIIQIITICLVRSLIGDIEYIKSRWQDRPHRT